MEKEKAIFVVLKHDQTETVSFLVGFLKALQVLKNAFQVSSSMLHYRIAYCWVLQ